MKKFLLLLLLFLVHSPSNAEAACVGGTCFGRAAGNWSNTTTVWAITSGGVACLCSPATGDAIVLDVNSGAGNYVIDANVSIVTLVTTGFTGTITHNSGITLTVSGNTFTLVSGMTFTAVSSTSSISFTSTSGTVALTSGGRTLGSIVFNGVGGTFQLQDALTIRTDGTITLTNGTFDTNNQTGSWGHFASSNTNTRVLTLGSSSITLTAINGAAWDLTTDTNLTLTSHTANLTFTMSGAQNSTYSASFGTSKTYHNITFSASTNATAANTYILLSWTTGFTVDSTLTINGSNVIRVGTAGATISNLVISGANLAGLVSITPSAQNTSPTYALTTSTINYALIGGITFTGSPIANNSIAFGVNSGITVNNPSGGGRCIGC